MSDEVFMQRALAVAAPMIGRTGSNPAVGCVIVKDGAVLAEAATGDGGRPHAEEQALSLAGEGAHGAVAYVTLEPCAQRSAGGVSCAQLLVAAGIVRVVFAVPDPHTFASGAGPAHLRAAGIVVEQGLCSDEARAQNADFLSRASREG